MDPVTINPAEARELCDATEWRLVAESEPEALAKLKLAQLQRRVEKARKEHAYWQETVADLYDEKGEFKLQINLPWKPRFKEKAAVFAEVLRRYEERLKQLEREAEAAPAKPGKKKPSQDPLPAEGQPLTADELMARLRKLRFFEGYSASAIKQAEARIRDQFAEGLSGPRRAYFERFPGFALVFLSIEGEWYGDPYGPLVERVAQNSFGMFHPTRITDKRDRKKGTATLSFTVEGQRYSLTVEDSPKWFPPEFLELIEEAFAKHCGKLHFHETLLSVVPDARGASQLTICTNRAYKALVKAKLLPDEASEI
jgi:hypothetical protein